MSQPHPYQSHDLVDIAIIGAGPIGLAIATSLARLELSVLVLDRRPPPDQDARLRRQLLVARPGDLAHLDDLGVNVFDPCIVAPLAQRCRRHPAADDHDCVTVDSLGGHGPPARTLRALLAQPPVALVPIGRLQQQLLALATASGAAVLYETEVTRLRRHAHVVSIDRAEGPPLRATVVFITTGAGRSLVADPTSGGPQVSVGSSRPVIAGVFDTSPEQGSWTRAELPVTGFDKPARCMVLQTPAESGAGTALLVDAPIAQPTVSQLRRCFVAASRHHELDEVSPLAVPQVFTAAVTSVGRRVYAGDGRAPVIIAGDAAQTGHVFTGANCFANLALALGLCADLARARDALADRKLGARHLALAFDRYESESARGAFLLAQASEHHFIHHAAGQWALPPFARAA